MVVTAGLTVPTTSPANATEPSGAVADPAALVHPLDGTGTGPVSPGTVGEFPGADTPFGMMQWSPDTSPDAVQSGGGYDYADSQVNGFSLTHLSGTGCPSYQDVPILPTVGAVATAGARTTPQATTASFSHQRESATPGRYQVELGPTPIGVTLAVTTRTGIASFDFPATTQANVLFKVADSANAATAPTDVHVVGHDEVEGQVSSGQFCQTGTNYTLHFVAQFDRPFSAAGTWTSAGPAAGDTSCTGTSCGAYVTFDTGSQHQVLMKVGISFVSDADAAQNLKAEDPGWSVARVAAAAHQQWNEILDRIAVGGGTAAEQHTFYTALYHSLLFPNVVSDVNGDYAGSDGKTHIDHGRQEYANFSEWDIYRSEIQLESLLDPHAVGEMVQSLVDDAEQGGWLPKWAIVGGDESQMNGDSADPIIADAYAMGARNFDVTTALRYMVKGATQSESNHGLEIERQYLSQYLTQHYINAGSLDLTSIDYSIGGSATLEYAIDDFSIAQIAAAQHDSSVATTMMGRASNWEYLFNPATGYIQARGNDGSFPPGFAFQASQLEPGGQTGFEEGNAIQYTWYVPQNLAALATLMGGDNAATATLERYFTQLNATPRRSLRLVGQRAERVGPLGVRLLRRARADPARRPCHRGRGVRRRTGRRTGQRRPRRHLLVVRLGRHRALPRDPRPGEPRPGEPAVSLRDHRLAGRPPPRRASPGGGGLPALHPDPPRLGHHAARDPGPRVRDCPVEPSDPIGVGHAVAARLCDQDRGHPDLRAFRDAGHVVGIGTLGQPTVLRRP